MELSQEQIDRMTEAFNKLVEEFKKIYEKIKEIFMKFINSIDFNKLMKIKKRKEY